MLFSVLTSYSEVKTYEQALSFLNVSEDFADDAVVAMYTTKVNRFLLHRKSLQV